MDQHLPVGQLVMLGFSGLQASPLILRLIDRAGVGGVFLFGPNLESKRQVAALTRELQAACPGPPLLVAIDQEGGRVQDWAPPNFEAIPAAAVLGAAWQSDRDTSRVREIAIRIGRELRELGVNVDFAPVLDVHTNPANPIIGDRSFGPSVETVATLGIELMRGLHETGVLACGKHFPGHGDTDLDSHRTLPVVSHTRERLDAVELQPFRLAIAAGLQTIMTAHVLYPALDESAPATTSPFVIDGLLRQRLGFDGIVFTDDLRMAGVRQGRDLLEAAVLAIQAGCDIALSCTELEAHEDLLIGLEKALASGDLSVARVAASLRRIEGVKRTWLRTR